jgi:mono/diheme cytochrome c family protein
MTIKNQITRWMAGSGIIAVIFLQASCYYPDSKPGWEYMPDMANAISYETYSENPFYADSMTSRKPVTGTIPRGVYQPFVYSMNPTGYDSAGLMLTFPQWVNEKSIPDGQHLYNIYCAVCHGSGGKGNGTIVENAKIKNPYPPPPSYFSETLLNLPEGKMYHSVQYGKNLMGAYSKALDQDQMWKVVYYVKSMQNKYKDSVATAMAKTAAAAAAAPADITKKNQ